MLPRPPPLPLLCCHAPAMQASQGTRWLLYLILSPVLLCFLNQRGSHYTKKMLSNRPAEKYTCVVKNSPPILESRELIRRLCSQLSVYFTTMPVSLGVTFWFPLFPNLAAIARAMEEWERRKEEGEVGNEPETEEENIYAVTKEQEVHCSLFVKRCAQTLIGQLSLLGRCWVEMHCGAVSGDAVTIFFLTRLGRKMTQNSSPIVQFDVTATRAQRLNSAPLGFLLTLAVFHSKRVSA